MHDLVIALLHTLLDRHEQPQRQRAVRIILVPKQHPAYFDSDSFEVRGELNAAFSALERDGVVRLYWEKHQKNNWLTKIELVRDRATVLYALLDRTPRPLQFESLSTLLPTAPAPAQWLTTFIAESRAALADHIFPPPFRRDDTDFNRDLLIALTALASLTTPTLERLLSVRLFNDSKRLMPLRPALVTVLKRYAPTAAAFGDNERALLQAHWLTRVPEYIAIAGPLVLCGADAPLDLAPFRPSLALSAHQVMATQVLECAATALVTIENSTSFTEWITHAPATCLTVYIGGFASPSVLHLLTHIRRVRPNLPCYHWGDLDAGGFRILAHLRTHLPAMQPLGMDTATFAAYHAYAQPLTAQDNQTLQSLLSYPTLTDCQPILHHLLTAGAKLEQEAVPAATLLPLLAPQQQ